MPVCSECANAIPDGDRFCGKCGTPVNHAPEVRGVVMCQFCASPMRRGDLFADREVTIILDNPQEERFMNLLACSRCGLVRLFVDYETDVDQ